MAEKSDKQRQKVIENFECKTEANYNDMGKNVVVAVSYTHLYNTTRKTHTVVYLFICKQELDFKI